MLFFEEDHRLREPFMKTSHAGKAHLSTAAAGTLTNHKDVARGNFRGFRAC